MEYDGAGRLIRVRDEGGAVLASYVYGATNERLASQEGEVRTYYVWSGSGVIAEYVEVGGARQPAWTKQQFYLGGRLLATSQPADGGERVEYTHPDRLGTRLVRQDRGGAYYEQETLPYGVALEGESSGGGSRRFTSYERSWVTGLDYAINRHYDSLQGRFTQVDPIGMRAANLFDPQSLNMYAYCGNDPINRLDPDGLFWGKLFKFFKKALNVLKWVAIAVTVAVAVLTILPFAWTIPVLAKISSVLGTIGIAGFAEGAAAGVSLSTVTGALIAADAAVGALANHLQDKKKAKKPNKYIVRAVADVAAILSGDNPCSKFFGPNAKEALKDLEKSLEIKSLGDTVTGIRMSKPMNVQNAATGARYRRFETVVVNRDGPFFSPSSPARVGGYPPGSRRSQALQILHEVAHMVPNPAGGGWLIPDDGENARQSERNTAEILKHCKGEIDKIK